MKLAHYKTISPSITEDIRAALAKHGLKVIKQSAGVDEMIGEVTLKITALDTAMSETPEEIRWKQYAHVYGLNPAWLGQTVTFGNGPAKIAGLLHTRSDKCILVEGAHGKRMICTMEALKRVAAKSGLEPLPPFRAIKADNLIAKADVDEDFAPGDVRALDPTASRFPANNR